MTLRFAFFASDKPREHLLADAFLHGVRKHGHAGEVRALGPEVSMEGFDVACMVGVKSRELLKRVTAAGANYLLLDKGYSRHKRRDGVQGWEYWRVALNAHHPTARLGEAMPSDRMRKMGWDMKPWRPAGAGPIILAGSSAKYHEFYGLKDPTSWMRKVVQDIRATTERPLIYRPKPSWRDAVPLLKTRYSQLPETLADIMTGAHALVTHGSNACFEAVLAGVPCVVLGEGVAKPISSASLDDVETPLLAEDKVRRQWAANLAFWQYSSAEMASGLAWDFLGPRLHG